MPFLAAHCCLSALRGWLLSVYDVRAAAIEVAWRWLDLAGPLNDFSTPSSSSSSSSSSSTNSSGERPKYQQQLLAMEALTIYCPLGHALGLGVCAAGLEDAAFKVGLGVCNAKRGGYHPSWSSPSRTCRNETLHVMGRRAGTGHGSVDHLLPTGACAGSEDVCSRTVGCCIQGRGM